MIQQITSLLSQSRYKRLIALLYAILIGLFLSIYFSNWAYDDPFITYRYAYNLAQGMGFVYNPGERVLSTTTPLLALLLASLFPVCNNLPVLANLIGIWSLCTGGVILWELGQLWKAPLAGWAGLFLYPSFSLLAATLGSEMPLYITLCLGALLFYTRGQINLAAVLAGLATLTRPDGFLIALLLFASFLFRERRLPPTTTFLVFLCLTAPWFLFAWIYFGSPIPATLLTKQHQASMPVSQGFLPGLQTMVSWYKGSWKYILAAILALAGTITMIMQRRGFLLLFWWSLLFITAYTFLGVGRYFWYYTPLVPTFVVLTGLGLANIGYLDKLKDRMVMFPSWVFNLPGFLAWGVLITLTVYQINNLWITKDQPDSRFPIYHEIGEWLGANTPANASIGSLEVGIIGYYAQRPMVDFAGLIQPQVAAQLTPQTTYEDAAIWAVENYQPDYLVLHAGAFPNLEKDYVLKNCQLIQDFQGSDYGYSAQMNIYSCQNT